jgi:hypothetical protein
VQQQNAREIERSSPHMIWQDAGGHRYGESQRIRNNYAIDTGAASFTWHLMAVNSIESEVVHGIWNPRSVVQRQRSQITIFHFPCFFADQADRSFNSCDTYPLVLKDQSREALPGVILCFPQRIRALGLRSEHGWLYGVQWYQH